MDHMEDAKMNVAESQTMFNKHKLITFPEHLDYMKTGNGSGLFPSRRRPCRRPGPTAQRIPFTRL